MKRVFTTGQVAKLCEVAPRTVSKWSDQGKIRGVYRIPDSQDRRIPREGLVRFLKEHGMPLFGLDPDGSIKLLVIGDVPTFDRIMLALPSDFRSKLASNVFDAGILAEGFRPEIVVIDLAIGRSEGLQIAGSLRQRDVDFLVALANEDETSPELLLTCGFNAVFQKPVDVTAVANRILEEVTK